VVGHDLRHVGPPPATTRDPSDTELTFDGAPVVLVDTAGIRRKSSSRDRLERYSLLRGIHAMERSDVVLLVIEAPTGVLAQDQHVAGYGLEPGQGPVIEVNQVDLVAPVMRKHGYCGMNLRRQSQFVPSYPAS